LQVLILCEVRVYLDALGAMLRDLRSRNTVRVADSLGGAMLDMTTLQADVLLFDVRAGGALRSAPAMQRRWPATRLVAFGLESSSQVTDCLGAGVSAALLRHAEAAELLRALGEEAPPAVLPATPAPPTPPQPGGRLTTREREVAALMARGLTNKQIARSLDIAVATTKNHVHCILEKLQTHSRLQAVLLMGSPQG
jgi:DNA-binding NarL/FixJ family response regulator